MSEVNQFRKQFPKQEGFENRNYNRQHQTNSNSQIQNPNARDRNFVRPANPNVDAPQAEPHKTDPEIPNDVNVPTQHSALVQNIRELDLERTANRKVNEKPINVQLTERDFKIIEFILEMKFASRNEVFQKFFSVTSQGPAKSNLYALERLALLEKAGFLKGVRSFSEITRYFVVTKKGYEALQSKVNFEKIPKPSPNIFERVFVHDKLVLLSRMEFEKAHPEGRWISDRKLRSGMAEMFSLPSVYIPDAIYELPTGEKVAFEFENALKGKSEYREKISYFAKLMDLKQNDPNMFSRVRYRCVREDVFRILMAETARYPGRFTVELWTSPYAKEGGGARPKPKSGNVGGEV